MRFYVYNIIIVFIFVYIHKPKKKCENIAHACGTIDSYKCTNSVEAFYQSYLKGYRKIEIDLLVTKDNHIVGGHDWKLFKTLIKLKNTQDINFNIIKKSKILNKYGIIYDNMIYHLLNTYKDVTIFTDKITNYDLLINCSIITNRLYVEVFSLKQYKICKAKGFRNVMLNIKNEKYLNMLFYTKKINISAVTVDPIIFYSHKMQLKVLYKKNIKIFAYLINNTTDINLALCNYVTGFYID